MPITEQQLLQILPNARPVAGIFVPALNRAMARWKIDSPVRQAAFLAQVGHESGQLRRLVENLNYSAEALVRTWPSRFTAQNAGAYARQPEKIANRVYGGRMGNGQETSGDGWGYRGRGLIQLTGRDNYRSAGQALGLPLLENPELLEQPEHAAQSAAWWWATHGLNELADAGRFRDIGSIINTGQPGRVPHGAAERKALYDLAVQVLA
ncbi:glycoside hydrolase family 19 protein [Pseudomonas mosselii]|uniref:glycoside hydrolase family 19 protein n=1 Tax=Pseudomonas mosselii TaxID=78327 RepID=UPI001F474206|nr:glycoside hydrolase family 19 protein [Pseudomonas mosselii]